MQTLMNISHIVFLDNQGKEKECGEDLKSEKEPLVVFHYCRICNCILFKKRYVAYSQSALQIAHYSLRIAHCTLHIAKCIYCTFPMENGTPYMSNSITHIAKCPIKIAQCTYCTHTAH
jgi:hypothetical protein